MTETGLLRLHLFTLFALCLALPACTFTSARPNEPIPRDEAADAQLGPRIVVAVYGSGADEPAVRNLAADLKRTRLFAAVLIGRNHPEANLGVFASEDWGAGKCGNPELTSRMTLGLLPRGTPYQHWYRFYFMSPSEDRRLIFERAYDGYRLSGLIALPLRLSSRWGRTGGVGAPKPFVALLRRDILAKRAEILPLVEDNAR